MVSKKSAVRAVPNVSAAASLSGGTSATRSAILRSAFSPSQFQLSLFASVVQALDSHQLRIHDTVSGRLKCEHAAPGANITCLDWGYYGSIAHRMSDEQPSKKKRRKLERANGDSTSHREDVVVAIGTSQSEIHLFSPAETKTLAVLKEGHTLGIRDFMFKNFGLSSEAWSVGGDGKLVQWDLRNGSISR